MTKQQKLSLNRYQKQNRNPISLSNPARGNLLKWGAVAGAAGGFLMIQPQVFWQIIGVFVIVFVANYHISKTGQEIPLWQAIVISLTGILAAMFGVIVVGTIMITYFQSATG